MLSRRKHLWKRIARRLRKPFKKNPHFFLSKIIGLIHVGANVGQERELYSDYDLNVLWIEPLPEIFLRLQHNLRDYPKQKALQYLVTDEDDKQYTFNVSSNTGASSSILKFGKHSQLWPQVTYVGSLSLRSITLPTLIRKESQQISDYEALVLDTQGSELLVLKGAADLLDSFKYVKTEVADFESYEGGCTVKDIEHYLKGHGFREALRKPFRSEPGVGSYYDIVYAKETPNSSLKRMG